MKNLKLTTLITLVLFVNSAAASKDLCDKLDGLWVMTQMNPVHPQSSSPTGLINGRSYFDAKTSKLYASLPDALEAPNSNEAEEVSSSVAYECNEGVLNFDIEKSPSYSATTSVSTIQSVSSEKLVINIESRSDLFGSNYTEQVYTRGFFQSKGDRFEPMSIHVLRNDDNVLNILDVEYDHKDYSDLTLNKRILGVWEVSRYKNVHRQEMPPYGLLNDIYTIKPNEICMLKRYPPEKTVCYPYELKDKNLTWIMDYKRYDDAVSFNEWGHLELYNGLTTQSLKLVTKDITAQPQMPLKVVLASVSNQ